MRSTAKPFQALSLIQDGVAERFEITPQELALTCASHNSEKTQVDLVRDFLARLDLDEGHLACGPHAPLGRLFSIPPLERELIATPSPLASNCSGKHTGMLALARHHDWETAGYNKSGHPVQQRILQEMARWTGLKESAIGQGIDGCTAVTFALPISRMAVALARVTVGRGEPERTIVAAMTGYPELVAGLNRLGTELMRAYSGELIVKVGAEGVYIAALKERGLGIGIKVEDGDSKASMTALVHVLDQLGLDPPPSTVVPHFAEMPVLNTRDEQVGQTRATGRLSFV
jgi:L-asparaginase II